MYDIYMSGLNALLALIKVLNVVWGGGGMVYFNNSVSIEIIQC
jgi:hypothetical protein